MAVKKRTFTIEVELTEPQVRYLCDQLGTPGTDGSKIAGIAAQALHDFSEGGMMVDGKVTAQILALTGSIEDTQDLVAFIEKGASRDHGRMVGKWYIDPTYEQPLKDIAESQGLTIDQVIQNLMDWGVAQGWAYQMSPETVTVFFSKPDYLRIQEVVERNESGHLAGSDIADYIAALAQPPALAPVEG